MKIKNILSILIMAMIPLAASPAVSADTILKRTAGKITSSRTLTANFTITGQSDTTIKGNAAVDGNKFKFSSSENSIAYNGKTQWTADASTREITIIEPEPDEIQQLNPFAVIKNYNSLYRCRLIASSGGSYRIEMLPKSGDGSITKILLTINSSDYMPTRLEMHLSDNSTVSINISDIKTGINIPASKFVLKASDFPGYEQIDLR